MRTRGKASGAAAGRNCHSFPQTRAASPPLIIITPQRGGHLEMKVARFPSGAFKVTRGWVQRLTNPQDRHWSTRFSLSTSFFRGPQLVPRPPGGSQKSPYSPRAFAQQRPFKHKTFRTLGLSEVGCIEAVKEWRCQNTAMQTIVALARALQCGTVHCLHACMGTIPGCGVSVSTCKND